jgi:hypothetical protein
MYCPSCGNEITVELKYCNRCGANLSLTPISYPASAPPPLRLTGPAVILGLMVTIGFGIIFGGVSELARGGFNPLALTWIIIFSMATLLGCTALLLRFWIKLISLSREGYHPPAKVHQPAQMPASAAQPQLPPRFEPVSSVTEHTTRTFSPVYKEQQDPNSR